jgi:uncharacterized protein (TIGR03067 family)
MKLLKTVCIITVAVALGMMVISCKSSNPASAPVPVKTELEGTWEGMNMDGIDQTQWTYIMALTTIIIQADAVEKYHGTFTLDTVPSPRHIDIIVTSGATASDAGKTIPGLYNLSGNILQMTANVPGSQRPMSMDAAPVLKLTLQQ